jgi:hypothetical protein
MISASEVTQIKLDSAINCIFQIYSCCAQYPEYGDLLYSQVGLRNDLINVVYPRDNGDKNTDSE